MYLLDCLHRKGIGVIPDWVPSHLITDERWPAFFDGIHLHEHGDLRKDFQPDWERFILNYGRNDVGNFLINNALFRSINLPSLGILILKGGRGLMFSCFLKAARNAVFLSLLFLLVCPLTVLCENNPPHEEQRMEDKAEEKTGMLEELLYMILPKTREKQALEITLNPSLDDPLRRDYIRMPFRIRYGITSNWEMSFRLNDFFDNPFRGNTGTGVSDIFLETKYQWKKYLKPYIDSATAFSVRVPIDDRLGTSDGNTHYQPQLIFSKTLPDWYKVVLSFSIHMDLLSDHPDFNDMPEGNPRYNALGLSLGAVYPKDSYSYSMEIFWITTEIDGGHENPVYVLPGFFWNMPKRRYKKLPGLLRLGLGLRFGLHDAEEDLAFIARLNWDIPIKKYLQDKRARKKDSGRSENTGEGKKPIEPVDMEGL